MMCWPKWPFLLMCVFHDVRHVEFRGLTGSQRTPGFGASQFLLSHLLIRVAFELDASCSFINVSCVIGLGIEVEAFRKAVI